MPEYRATVAAAGRGSITGIVGDDIVVIPDMDPRRVDAVVAAKGVIAEVGGPLAHIAIVSRELGLVLMVMPGACSAFPPGTRLTLNPYRCEIIVH